MSRQRPLIDTLPNAVGLKYKSSSPLPGTYAHRAPEPISRRSPSRLPFAFTPLCLSYLCRSQSLAASCSLSTLRHQAATRPTPFHIYLPLHLPLLSVSLSLIVFFLLHLSILLGSFLLCLPLIPCIYLRTSTFMCCHFTFSVPVSHLLMYFPSQSFTCVEVGLNLYELINSKNQRMSALSPQM